MPKTREQDPAAIAAETSSRRECAVSRSSTARYNAFLGSDRGPKSSFKRSWQVRSVGPGARSRTSTSRRRATSRSWPGGAAIADHGIGTPERGTTASRVTTTSRRRPRCRPCSKRGRTRSRWASRGSDKISRDNLQDHASRPRSACGEASQVGPWASAQFRRPVARTQGAPPLAEACRIWRLQPRRFKEPPTQPSRSHLSNCDRVKVEQPGSAAGATTKGSACQHEATRSERPWSPHARTRCCGPWSLPVSCSPESSITEPSLSAAGSHPSSASTSLEYTARKGSPARAARRVCRRWQTRCGLNYAIQA